MTPPAPPPGPEKGNPAVRAVGVGCFVAILAWLSVVIGVGVLNLVSRPWCAAGSACAQIFWPRILIAAAGGGLGFLLCGYGLLTAVRARPLAAYCLGGLVLALGSGVWFLPVLTS